MEKSTVEFYRMDSEQMNESIDRIVIEVHRKKNLFGKKTILMTGCGSMAGVTSISINLAIALSMAGWKTLLIDSDLRKSNKYKRLGAKKYFGLSEYLLKEAKLEEVIHNTNHENLDYISCGSTDKSPVRMLCSNEMQSLMEQVEKDYEYIIIDSPSLNIVSDSKVLFPLVDGIVLVGALNQMTKHQLDEARRTLSHYKEKYYGIIINKVEPMQYRKYNRDFDYFHDKNLKKKHEIDMKKIRNTKEGKN